MLPGLSIPGNGNSLQGGTSTASAKSKSKNSTSDTLSINSGFGQKSFVFNNGGAASNPLIKYLAIGAALVLAFFLFKKKA